MVMYKLIKMHLQKNVMKVLDMVLFDDSIFPAVSLSFWSELNSVPPN